MRGHCKQVLRLNQGCSSRDSGMKITVDLIYIIVRRTAVRTKMLALNPPRRSFFKLPLERVFR